MPRCLVALLTTPLGLFLAMGSGLVCEVTPDPDYQGYFRRERHPVTGPSNEGALLITVGHRPFAVLRCELRRETTARGETWAEWECR